MTILPMPSTIKLHSHSPVTEVGLVTTERKLIHIAAAAATIKTNPMTNTSHKHKEALQLNSNPYHHTMLDDDFSPGPIASSISKLATKDEGLEQQVGILMQRLETVGERMRELELEKLKSKIKGQMTCEERILVEDMSREIVSSFFEKPIQYLKSCEGKLEDKLKDLNFLVGILEESFW